jgi:hypothetical protein
MSRRCGGLRDQECRHRSCDPPIAWRRFSLKKLRLARSAAYGFGERVLGTSRGSERRLHKHVADRCYRGAGKPEANYLIERDHAACRLGVDPIALRRRNLISRFPYRSGLGVTIDYGRFAANLEELAQRIRDDGFAARRRAAAERGRLRGFGIACFLETSRGTPGERAEIRFEADQPTGPEVRPTRCWRGQVPEGPGDAVGEPG